MTELENKRVILNKKTQLELKLAAVNTEIASKRLEYKEKTRENNKITIPFLGELNIKNVSIPLAAIILGFLDGFNISTLLILLFFAATIASISDNLSIERCVLLTTASVGRDVSSSNITIRENTLARYRNMVDNQVKPYIGNKRLTSLTTVDIQKLYKDTIKHDRTCVIRNHTQYL